ncbi:MAG TPA: adenylosuccinate synthetase, partial [Labilithrix sp.]
LPDSEAARRELAVLESGGAMLWCLDAYEAFHRRVRVVGRDFLERELHEEGAILFEGAQGVLLDQDFGFQPHTTWTDITFGNARELLGAFDGRVTRLGILRAYQTRHGAGPFVTEDASLAGLSSHDHNGWGEWQGSFRSGWLDLVATRYALDVIGGVDALVVTNLDRIALGPNPMRVATAYDGASDATFFDAPDRIRVKRPFDLAHQEALTRALATVAPRYETFPRAAYADRVAERLAVPLFASSSGPRARDKMLRTLTPSDGTARNEQLSSILHVGS